jgi:hypothetical protein
MAEVESIAIALRSLEGNFKFAITPVAIGWSFEALNPNEMSSQDSSVDVLLKGPPY